MDGAFLLLTVLTPLPLLSQVLHLEPANSFQSQPWFPHVCADLVTR